MPEERWPLADANFDELLRRGEPLLERRRRQAQFRDPQKTLDNFDFDFNKEDESQPGL